MSKTLTITFFLFFSFFSEVYGDWFVSRTKQNVAFDPRVYKNKYIVCKFDSDFIHKGSFLFFYSIDKKIHTIADLTSAKLWKISKVSQKKKLYNFIPPKNGTYYFAVALAEKQISNRQSYRFWPIKKTVTIYNLSNENRRTPAAVTETKETPLTRLGSNQNKKNTASSLSENLSETAGYKDYFVKKPNSITLREIDLLTQDIRKLKKSIYKEKYFTEQTTFDYLLRYTAIAGRIESLYLTAMLEGLEWSYIKHINENYYELTGLVAEMNRKVIEHHMDKTK